MQILNYYTCKTHRRTAISELLLDELCFDLRSHSARSVSCVLTVYWVSGPSRHSQHRFVAGEYCDGPWNFSGVYMHFIYLGIYNYINWSTGK